MKAQSRVPVIGHTAQRSRCTLAGFPGHCAASLAGTAPAARNMCPSWLQAQPEQGSRSGEGPALMPTLIPAHALPRPQCRRHRQP